LKDITNMVYKYQSLSYISRIDQVVKIIFLSWSGDGLLELGVFSPLFHFFFPEENSEET